MKTLLRPALMTLLGLALLSLPAVAGTPKSITKIVAGMSYKLTLPNPLPIGEQKLLLKVMKGATPVKGTKMTAQVSMSDGMHSPVKIIPKSSGELELMTKFGMGGDWQLKIQQTAPIKAQVVFNLTVASGSVKMSL